MVASVDGATLAGRSAELSVFPCEPKHSIPGCRGEPESKCVESVDQWGQRCDVTAFLALQQNAERARERHAEHTRAAASRRVVEKLGIRDEGVAVRYLEINGAWEDHVRYGITVEEWNERRDELVAAWIERPRDLV